MSCVHQYVGNKMNNVECWKKLSIYFIFWSVGHSAYVRVRLFNTTGKDLLIPSFLINPYRTKYELISGLENYHCLAAGLNDLTQIAFTFQNSVSKFFKAEPDFFRGSLILFNFTEQLALAKGRALLPQWETSVFHCKLFQDFN